MTGRSAAGSYSERAGRAATVSTHTVGTVVRPAPQRAYKPAPPPPQALSVWPIASAASSGRLCRAISQRRLQRRDQLRACRRAGLRQLKSIAEGEHGVVAQIVLTCPLLCLRVVMLQEFVPADG